MPNPTQPWRDPGLTDTALQQRWGITRRANRLSLPPQQLFSQHFDRPTILVPIGVPNGLIYYQAVTRPGWSSSQSPNPTAASSLRSDAALKSIGPGICLCWAPGEWHFFYDGSGSLEVAFVPAEDGSIVARFLQEPGTHAAVSANTGQFSAAAKTVASNRDRKALIVQNTGGAGTIIRVGVGYAAVYGIPPAGSGIALSSQGTLTLSGDTLWKGDVTIAASGATPYEVVELI